MKRNTVEKTMVAFWFGLATLGAVSATQAHVA